MGLLFSVVTYTHTVYADITKIPIYAKEDAFVNESSPNSNMGKVPLLQTGFRDNKITSYIKFNIESIPDTNLMDKVVIDSAEIKLLAQSVFGTEHRYFVIMNSCFDNLWSEESITWNNRVCQEKIMGEDSIIVDSDELPDVYTWDVTTSISHAINKGFKEITFVITAFPLSSGPVGRDIIPENEPGNEESWGFVRFWSSEREEFVLNATPTLIVTVNTIPTEFIASLNFLGIFLTVMIPVVGGMVWMYKKAKK